LVVVAGKDNRPTMQAVFKNHRKRINKRKYLPK
jgi:hypothetical protein